MFVWNRWPVGLVAVITAFALLVTGQVGPERVVAGFGDPVVVFLATLFVISAGLEETGVTAWAGERLTRADGVGRARIVLALLGVCAALAAVITPNGATAAMLPVAVVVARRVDVLPSRLLLPLAFAASAGAMLTLSGSVVNVIVSDASRGAGGPGFGYFEFALVGVPLVAVTAVIGVWLGPRLLPERTSALLPPDFSTYRSTVTQHYGLSGGVFRLGVRPGSSVVGSAFAGVVMPDGLELVGAHDVAGLGVTERQALQVGDSIVVAGARTDAERFASTSALDLEMVALSAPDGGPLLSRDQGVAEVVVPPRSPLRGLSVFPGMRRASGLTILAVRRLGQDRGLRPTALEQGDALLVHGGWPAVEALSHDRELLLVDQPDAVRRQVVPLGSRAGRALAVLAATVALLASGVVAPAVAGLAGAAAMVGLRVLTSDQAYRAVSWQTVVLIGALIPMSEAIRASGAADIVADVIVAAGGRQPYVLLVVLFLVTAVLGQVVSNTATTLIMVPIALVAAQTANVPAQPVLMLMAVAGAASFLTPIATPANMMVMEPAGYRFGDYWRLGLVMMLAWLAITLLLVPVFWPL
nr:SLC13 family permease [Sanguibacter hominis]